MRTVVKAETHASQRLEQRYGVEFDAVFKTRVIREIKATLRRRPGCDKPRSAWLTGPGNTTRQRWAVVLDDRRFNLVYDTIKGVIMTFLPPDAGRPPHAMKGWQ